MVNVKGWNVAQVGTMGAKRVGRNYLALREEDWCKRAVFLVEPDLQDPYDVSRIALLTYAVYRAVHILRFSRPAGTSVEDVPYFHSCGTSKCCRSCLRGYRFARSIS